MKHLAWWAVLLVVVLCGALAAGRLMQLRAESDRALSIMGPAVQAVLEREGFRVESQSVGATVGEVSGVDASGARVHVAWGAAELHGYTLSAEVQAEGHDDGWQFNRKWAVLAGITREVSRRCGHPCREVPDLSSASTLPFEYESR